jgi:hypothetical protein
MERTPGIIGSPSYALIQRGSTASQNVRSCPVGDSSQNTLVTLPAIQATQAIRLVSFGGFCQDLAAPAVVGKILIRGLIVILGAGPGNAGVRFWPGTYGGVIVGAAGQALNVTDDEYIRGNDYQEQGGAAGNVAMTLALIADINNTNAAAQNVNLQIEVLFELYNVERESMRLFTKESQLAAQGVPANLLR